MKTIKTYKNFLIRELNHSEQEEEGYNFAVCMGEYNDIEFECDTMHECIENIDSYNDNDIGDTVNVNQYDCSVPVPAQKAVNYDLPYFQRYNYKF